MNLTSSSHRRTKLSVWGQLGGGDVKKVNWWSVTYREIL